MLEGDDSKFAANNNFKMFLHNIGPIFLEYSWVGLYEGSIFFWKLLGKSSFWASNLGNGPLLEHGPVKEILRYFEISFLQ